ncbi:MAG: hypothetical protein AB7U85_04770 [Alphaproteobacteria bacterium]
MEAIITIKDLDNGRCHVSVNFKPDSIENTPAVIMALSFYEKIKGMEEQSKTHDVLDLLRIWGTVPPY